MVTRPNVLFADEPTGALDSQSAHLVLDPLRSIVDAHAVAGNRRKRPGSASRVTHLRFLIPAS
jgi:ABC-type antimicrobial peptide transport system, ATPase component